MLLPSSALATACGTADKDVVLKDRVGDAAAIEKEDLIRQEEETRRRELQDAEEEEEKEAEGAEEKMDQEGVGNGVVGMEVEAVVNGDGSGDGGAEESKGQGEAMEVE